MATAAPLQPTSFALPNGLSLSDDSVALTSHATTNGNGVHGTNGTTLKADKVLVIGSLETAQDRSYQALVQALEAEHGQTSVDRQLWDRITAGGASLTL